MKVLIALLFILSMTCGGCGDSPGKTHPTKLDTLHQALFKIRYPNGKLSVLYADTVICQISSKWVFKDSANNSGGHWVSDTSAFGRVVEDTARDGFKKPLFDSLHRPIWHYTYYIIPKGAYLQRITIPNN